MRIERTGFRMCRLRRRALAAGWPYAWAPSPSDERQRNSAVIGLRRPRVRRPAPPQIGWRVQTPVKEMTRRDVGQRTDHRALDLGVLYLELGDQALHPLPLQAKIPARRATAPDDRQLALLGMRARIRLGDRDERPDHHVTPVVETSFAGMALSVPAKNRLSRFRRSRQDDARARSSSRRPRLPVDTARPDGGARRASRESPGPRRSSITSPISVWTMRYSQPLASHVLEIKSWRKPSYLRVDRHANEENSIGARFRRTSRIWNSAQLSCLSGQAHHHLDRRLDQAVVGYRLGDFLGEACFEWSTWEHIRQSSVGVVGRQSQSTVGVIGSRQPTVVSSVDSVVVSRGRQSTVDSRLSTVSLPA